jgi:hypothetical protein
MRRYGLRILNLLQNHFDTNEIFDVSMSTDGARICLSLHVYASDQGKGRDNGGIKLITDL